MQKQEVFIVRAFFYNFKIKMSIAVGIVFCAVCVVAFWYFAYYTKTPEYSVQMIAKAVTEHDVNSFNKYVDRPKLSDDLADTLINTIMQADPHKPENTSVALQEYSAIFKSAFVQNFNTALDVYVKNGKWPEDGQSTDYMSLIESAGLNDFSVQSYKLMTVDKAAKTAIVNIDIVQNEIEKPFTFVVTLVKQDNGIWTVEKVNNFDDFLVMINKERRKYLSIYVKSTDLLMSEHKKTFSEIDEQLQRILSTSSIGNNTVRASLKNIINDSMLLHWHTLRDNLAAVDSPKSARTLQKLRLQICDSYIAYYENYAKWLDDKDIKSLRAANENLKKAKTLEINEINLTNIIKRNLSE